jgi:TonB-dependent starch-binding outer membrane protein SusC
MTGLVLSSGELRAQAVSLQMDSVEVKTVLDNIRKQTRMHVIYSQKLLRGARKISIHVTDTPLVYVMEHICKGQRFHYHITKFIFLTLKNGPEKKKPIPARGNHLYGFTRNNYGEKVAFVCLTDLKKFRTYISDSRGYYFINNIELKTKLTITGPNLETTEIEVTRLGKCDIPVKEKPVTYHAYEMAFTSYQPLIKKTTPSSPIHYQLRPITEQLMQIKRYLFFNYRFITIFI